MKRVRFILLVLVFQIGLGICLYPYIQGRYAEKISAVQVRNFLEQIVPENLPESIPTKPREKETMQYSKLWEDAVHYNQMLWDTKQVNLSDPIAYQKPSLLLGDYGIDSEVFAVLSIPKLNLTMPVYLGATEEHTANGTAHLSQTSLPIGGINTNCVIAGHRGFGASSYFKYVPDLEPGDEVIITNLWEQLVYTVTGTAVIEPHEVNKILIEAGKDQITLMTCHPYASGGRYRYLVFCERVEGDEQLDINKSVQGYSNINP